jgi:hypothetical protein
MSDRDPFDDDFFDGGVGPSTGKMLAAGVVATILSLVLSVVFYGAIVAVVLWVALTVLEHFGVLMVGLGAVA